MSETLIKKIFVGSIVFLFTLAIFTYGLAVGGFKLWPFESIQSMYSATLSIIRYGELVPANRLIKAPEYISRERFVAYDQQKVQAGYYAFMGYNGAKQHYEAWLLNDQGEQLHTWDLSYLPLDNDGPLNGSDSPHAFKVLEDGSLIVSFDSGDVLARIDQCSKPIWTKKGVYHHSLERANDGSFWAWRGDNTAYGHYNYLSNFNADTGETIQEIGLIEDLVQTQTVSNNAFNVRADYPFKKFLKDPEDKAKYDIFHPNDIDVLQPEIADKFENFSAGDLLISLRNNHLVAVIDPKTKTLKWWGTGPWKFQHDPDFTSDGKISIYSNNTHYDRSEILKVDPSTNEITNELEHGNLFFYSKYQGKHQYLPNGNVLITVPDEGRTVQVTPQGDIVFEHNNISNISNQYNEYFANSIWLDKEYFTNIPNCAVN